MYSGLKSRRKTSHKGQNGTVAIIGGSEDYPGSPALVGMAALAVLRSGADLVHVIAPEKVAWAINCVAPDLITHKLPGKKFRKPHLRRTIALAKKADVLVIGNGITLSHPEAEFVRAVIKEWKKPIVLDAAALRIINLKEVRHAVMLPHQGELQTLLKNSKLAQSKVQKNLNNNILVLKGHPKTTILSKTRRAVNATGHPGMTHGGTGDVLAGIIAALIAQGNTAFESCRIATYANGKAAEQLAKTHGFGYLASDIVSTLPGILKKCQRVK